MLFYLLLAFSLISNCEIQQNSYNCSSTGNNQSCVHRCHITKFIAQKSNNQAAYNILPKILAIVKQCSRTSVTIYSHSVYNQAYGEKSIMTCTFEQKKKTHKPYGLYAPAIAFILMLISLSALSAITASVTYWLHSTSLALCSKDLFI